MIADTAITQPDPAIEAEPDICGRYRQGVMCYLVKDHGGPCEFEPVE